MLYHDLGFIFLFFCLFRAATTAYGGSQARGLIGATAASLHHSHSNFKSKPCLKPTAQRQIFNPLSEAKDRTHKLMVPSWIHFHCTMMGTPILFSTCLFFLSLPKHTSHLE